MNGKCGSADGLDHHQGGRLDHSRADMPGRRRGDRSTATAATGWTGTIDRPGPRAIWWTLSRPGGGIHMRYILEDRWKLTDVYAHGAALTATDLQAAPITRLDLLLNLTSDHLWTVAATYNDLATKAGWGPMVTVIDHEQNDDPPLSRLRQLAATAPPALPTPPSADRPRLTRPDGTDPDGFAARVAAAYCEYAQQTYAPAAAIAKEAGIPIATARSWIREARRRGKLPQGRKGKAG
jgi:hypothetical protein